MDTELHDNNIYTNTQSYHTALLKAEGKYSCPSKMPKGLAWAPRASSFQPVHLTKGEEIHVLPKMSIKGGRLSDQLRV